MNVANEFLKNVAKFKYLGMKVTNQNLFHEEIKIRLNSVNACYRAVQNLFSSRLLPRNPKIKTYKTNFTSYFAWCET
jgi:hypothetical protein